MDKLYSAATDQRLGDMIDEQLWFVIDQFEEEREVDQDFYVDNAPIDMLKDASYDPSLLALPIACPQAPPAKPTSAGRASERLHHQRRPPHRLSPQRNRAGARSPARISSLMVASGGLRSTI